LFFALRAPDLAGGAGASAGPGGATGVAGSTLTGSAGAGGKAAPGVGELGTGLAGTALTPPRSSPRLVGWWIRLRWTAANSNATKAARKLDKTIA